MRKLLLSGLMILCATPAMQAQSTQKWPEKVPTNGPVYKVDPFWPKPLPNKWSMQQIVDIYIDKDDHIWIINRQTDARPDETGAMTNHHIECCVLGPEIIEFDQAGNVLKAWGGPNYAPGWPGRLQTLGVDRNLNVYVSGTTPGDSIIKFDSDGKFLWDFGHRGPKIPANQVKQNNQQTDIFPPGIGAFDFDEDAHEIYISDGFLNKRILVYDMDTGAFKRGWGGHGIPLSEIDNDPTPDYDISGPPPDQKQFAPALHCAHPSKDGFVYVCERGSDRIQVFTKQGKFVTSFWIHPSTQSRGPHCGGIWSTTDPPCGTIYNMALSTDPQQRYIFVADGTNNTVWILNRKDGSLAGSFGGNGRYAGMLHWIDAIAVDSKGNVYTGEVEDGKRIQKFVPVSGNAAAKRK
jgi:DNA-binding beta-propeller fold protein YncE